VFKRQGAVGVSVRPLDEGDQITLRIFTVIMLDSFLIGAAVAIHVEGIWFPEETSWVKIGGLYMMMATFVQMIAFMIYKIFAQERLQDQQHYQGMMNKFRREMKMKGMEVQGIQMQYEMDKQQQEMEARLEQLRAGIGSGAEPPPPPPLTSSESEWPEGPLSAVPPSLR
jgi:hypothetical protein